MYIYITNVSSNCHCHGEKRRISINRPPVTESCLEKSVIYCWFFDKDKLSVMCMFPSAGENAQLLQSHNLMFQSLIRLPVCEGFLVILLFSCSLTFKETTTL